MVEPRRNEMCILKWFRNRKAEKLTEKLEYLRGIKDTEEHIHLTSDLHILYNIFDTKIKWKGFNNIKKLIKDDIASILKNKSNDYIERFLFEAEDALCGCLNWDEAKDFINSVLEDDVVNLTPNQVVGSLSELED